MTNNEKILKYMEDNCGTITTKEVVENGISRSQLTQLLKAGIIERVIRGVYVSSNAWGDEFFNLMSQSKNAIFSHNTALYFQNLTDQTPYIFDITVPRGYNGLLQKNKRVHLFYVKRDLYNLGLIKIKSPQGKMIRSFNVERTICDILRSENRMNAETVKNTIKAYLQSSNQNIYMLHDYAKQFRVDNKLNHYMEVLL